MDLDPQQPFESTGERRDDRNEDIEWCEAKVYTEHLQPLEISKRGKVRNCGFEDVSNQWGANSLIDEVEGADVSGNPVGAGSDYGAPFLHGLPVREGDGGEEVVLAAIDQDGGYQGSGFEELATPHIILPPRGQLVNDKVPNVLRNVCTP